MSEVRIDDTQLPLQVGGTVTTVATPPAISQLWTSGTLVAGLGNDTSAWVNVETFNFLLLSRAVTGGVYAFEVEWSRDGVAVDIIEALVVANNVSLEKRVAAKFARFRVKNTDALPFTAHRTNVFGR